MFSLKEEKRVTKILLAITCILFFAVCLFTIIKYGNSTMLGNLKNPDNDDAKFVRSAWILADTGNYVYHNPPIPTTFMMPGVSYTLALFTILFGKLGGLTGFRLFQAILQTVSLMLVFFLGRKVFNSKVGAIAAVMNALCISEVWTSNLLLTETFFKYFVLNMVFFCIYALEEKKAKYYVIAGIFWGIATLFRPTITLFPAVILIMWFINKYTFKDILKNTIIVSIVFCTILSPWWIRNYNIFHKFIPLTTATGNPMLQGTFINYDQNSSKTDGLDYKQFNHPTGDENTNNTVEIKISKYRLQNLVPKQPLEFLYWYTIGKTAFQIDFPFYWREILGINYIEAGVYYYIVMLFSIIGIVLFFKNKKRNNMGILLFSAIIYFIVVYLPFYTCTRYFYPAMPYVIIFAASGALYVSQKYRIIERVRNLRRRFL
jgi:4-amino-4-deoxy-L-arabinose transferase-like glycosyltransferase